MQRWLERNERVRLQNLIAKVSLNFYVGSRCLPSTKLAT